ncbi:hypothetical protein, partial [Paenibacillus zanthoxyli]|uniref:hypothetical protein n=1 Tax=Paenibacillus zanthoxyli TaxID=369399 RepID=UPI001E470236
PVPAAEICRITAAAQATSFPPFLRQMPFARMLSDSAGCSPGSRGIRRGIAAPFYTAAFS